MPMRMYSANMADETSQPLLDERAPLYKGRRGGTILGTVTRYAGAAVVGGLLVTAGFLGSGGSQIKVRALTPLGAGQHAAAAPHRSAYRRAAATPTRTKHHQMGSANSDAHVGRLGMDDIEQIDALNDQVVRLTQQLATSRTNEETLEKAVQRSEQSIVDTREEFSKGAKGTKKDTIIADLENQLRDKTEELVKTREAKYVLYAQNSEANARASELDKRLATSKKNEIEYAERADALADVEQSQAAMQSALDRLDTCGEKLEDAMTDLRAARGSDHDENKRIAALEDRLNANQDERDRMSADIEAFKINAADYKKEAAHAKALVDELTAKAGASDELADRLKGEIATLVNDVQECELNGKKSFDFFCAGEGENCDCPDGDIVWGPRFHAANPEAENSFADVIAGKKFIVKDGKNGFECANKNVGGDPDSGEVKACYCVPKGLTYNIQQHEEQRTQAEPAEEPAAAPAPEVVEDPVVAAEDMESYEDSLANAPGHVEPEGTPLDVAEELSKQFERNVGDETIREVETDAGIREDHTDAPAPDTNSKIKDDHGRISFKGEDWKKYESEELDDLFEDTHKRLDADKADDTPEDVKDREENTATAVRVNRHLHAIHQLPELDAPPRHDHLDVLEQVPEVSRGQRGTRHDHDERFAQLTQAREDSGELTERWVVDVLVDDIEAELGKMLAGRPVAVEGFPKGP